MLPGAISSERKRVFWSKQKKAVRTGVTQVDIAVRARDVHGAGVSDDGAKNECD